MRSLLGLCLVALSFFASATVAESHGRRRHHDAQAIARRASGDINIHKRFDGARFTFYAVGLGACGQTNVPSDFIVALNTPQFGGGYPGPNCFKMITITYGGKSTQAQIMDECPGCPYGGLDFSTGLFNFFAAESVGVLYGSWTFDDGSGGGGSQPTTTKQAPAPDTTTSSKWQPPPTTSSWEPPSTTPTPKWEPPTTTSTWEPPTSTWPPPPKSSSSSSSSSSHSSTSSSRSSQKASSSMSSSTSSSGWAVPTGAIGNPNDPQNILSLNQVIVGIGGLVVAGNLV